MLQEQLKSTNTLPLQLSLGNTLCTHIDVQLHEKVDATRVNQSTPHAMESGPRFMIGGDWKSTSARSSLATSKNYGHR